MEFLENIVYTIRYKVRKYLSILQLYYKSVAKILQT